MDPGATVGGSGSGRGLELGAQQPPYGGEAFGGLVGVRTVDHDQAVHGRAVRRGGHKVPGAERKTQRVHMGQGAYVVEAGHGGQPAGWQLEETDRGGAYGVGVRQASAEREGLEERRLQVDPPGEPQQ